MGKLKKVGEYATGTPPYKPYERKGKRRRTKEEKQVIIKKIDQIIDNAHHTLHPMLTSKVKKFTEKEKERERERESLIPTCTHEKSIEDTDGSLVCRYCGVRLNKKKDRKKIFLNLFCIHKKTIVQNGYLICVKCKEKVKKLV